jgi:hypothetical protein
MMIQTQAQAGAGDQVMTLIVTMGQKVSLNKGTLPILQKLQV